MAETIIEVKNASFKYKTTEALKNVNLKIEKGEAIAFIGPNGSGKSTFLKLLNGIVFPESGEYFFNNTNITEKALKDNKFSKEFHKRIGFVFQNSDTQLFCANVYEEIAFGPRQMGLDEKTLATRVEDCLKLLRIEKLKDREPFHLSGGEKKKVAIASILSLNPEVLVLDEPMNGLDPRTKRFLRELLIEINNAGKTVLCSTHDFEYINGIFNRAVVFSEDHTIIRDDSYEVIINDEEFLISNNIK